MVGSVSLAIWEFWPEQGLLSIMYRKEDYLQGVWGFFGRGRKIVFFSLVLKR